MLPSKSGENADATCYLNLLWICQQSTYRTSFSRTSFFQCTCNCQGSFDDERCRKLGGEYCNVPFHDPLFRRRDVLAPNEVFGTRNCYSGYEGSVDGEDLFTSCHLVIYEPSFYVRHTRAVLALSIISAIGLLIAVAKCWLNFKSREAKRRKQRRLKENQSMNLSTGHALSYNSKKRK